MILDRFLKVWRSGDKFWPKFYTAEDQNSDIRHLLKQENELSHLGITQHHF